MTWSMPPYGLLQTPPTRYTMLCSDWKKASLHRKIRSLHGMEKPIHLNDLKRILLKLSGEALAGDKDFGFDEATCLKVAEQVKQITDKGTQVAIVIGGGNFWRGRNSSKIIERTKSDQIGMLGTVMNCIYVSEIFRTLGMPFTHSCTLS